MNFNDATLIERKLCSRTTLQGYKACNLTSKFIHKVVEHFWQIFSISSEMRSKIWKIYSSTSNLSWILWNGVKGTHNQPSFEREIKRRTTWTVVRSIAVQLCGTKPIHSVRRILNKKCLWTLRASAAWNLIHLDHFLSTRNCCIMRAFG